MDPRLRRRTWWHLIQNAATDADNWLAARLDTRPLAETAIDTAAWAGRCWHHALTTARRDLHGPARGLIAVVITTDKEN
ncbi:hypothetical protein [Nocardiopsis ansamitocini]|uniref:Uncharacterized protein n=1 Tax=Nocardiopsis ansamitocini TaxID=1670832 RepID=A0A9W6UKQ3_9ACTN|nr:hypothetical protein [Nocardiopsis ansamitocini]GLU49848.1 hypothetical protein Nans01_41990 [Nocardiopsis ansamitocini]